MTRTLFFTPLLAILFVLRASAPLLAQTGTTYYVRTNGSDASNGTAWNAAFQTLQKALATAQAGSQIWVATGTYYPDEGPGQTDNVRSSVFSMKNGVSILGGFPATGTPTLSDRNPASFTTVLSGDIDKNNVLDDGNAYHVISNGSLDNTAVLDGFVITGGNANGSADNRFGGGVLNNGYGSVCSLSFRNCTFQGNNAINGGAMNNSGTGTGGTSSPTLTNCSFQNNSATNGGAMYNYGVASGISSPTLTNCSFQNNSATRNGGAMYNIGYSGGTSSPTLTNCSFQNNSATRNGGAMRNEGNFGTSSPTLTNCVLFGNGEDNTIYNISASVSASYSLFEPGTTGVDVSGPGNLFTDPQFVDAANGNLRLQPTSCAINAGDPNTTTATVGTTDLAGQPRFFGGRVDMGAYEYQGNPTPRQPTPYPNTANNGLNFDGANDFVSIPFADILNCSAVTPSFSALTIEYWFKGSNIQSAVRFQNGSDYVSAGYGSATNPQHILSNDGGVTTSVSVGTAVTDGTWHHVAMTWQQGGQFTSYLDGQVVASRAASNNPLPTISNFYLGSFNGTGEFMNGSLDEVRVWNVTRTQQQIQQSLTGCQSPIGQPGLVFYYAFDQATANGTNAGQTRLLNKANPDQYPGTLSNFALSGSTSNWVAGAPLTPPATRLYVKAGASGASTGLSWADAFPDLQSALTYPCSQSLTEIWVAAGTYYPDEGPGQTNNARTSAFSMKNGVSILGGFPATGTPTLSDRNPASFTTVLSGDLDKNNTLDNGNAYHVISNGSLDNTAVLDGFVITGGNADGSSFPDDWGGGVLNNQCSPTFRNCAFQLNTAVSGGAMYNNGFSGGTSSPTLTNCSFQNNMATGQYGQGGAMYNNGANSGTSSPTLTNCSFQSNTNTTGQGGAMYNDASIGGTCSPMLTNCSFQANMASNGGAMYNHGFTSRPTLTNCVLFGNGGGNTIVNINSASVSATYSLFEPGTTNVNVSGPGNLVGDPQFVDAANGNLRLQPTSCAINTGDPATTTATVGTTDLAGQPRFYNNARVDMGAYEYQGNPTLKQPTTYPNAANNALQFDGTNNFVQVGFTDAVNCAAITPGLTNALTIEYWFKGTNLQSAVRFQNGGNYVSAGYGNATAGFQHILSNDGGVGGLSAGSTATITDGNWHHIAMTWQQGQNFTSYLDGVQVAQRNASNTPLPAIGNLFLGSFNGMGEFMNGALDEVRVWNVARTPAQIQQSLNPCTSPVGQPGLVIYYPFDQATANASNPGQTTLLNKANPDQYPGTLSNFALTGNTSNWVAGTPQSPLVLVTAGPVAGSAVCAGSNVTASVSTTGAITGYQWYRNGAVLTGNTSATTATLSLPSATTANSGSYSVVVTGACNSVTSTAFSLTVVAYPVPIISPSAVTICAGTSATLTASDAIAGRTTTFNWTGGAGTAAISVSAAGTYSVTATTSGCASVTTASVTVNPVTSLVSQPVTGSLVCAGASVVTSVSAVGTGPFAYQWYKNSLSTSVASQTTSTLSLPGSTTADTGRYSVVVTGSCGSVTSTAFSLTVNALPPVPALSAASRTLFASAAPLSLSGFVIPTGNPLSFSGASGLLANPPMATISQAGVQSFSVSQANGCVSPTTVFSLTILPNSPSSQTVCRSSAVVLVAGAFGSKYEWYKNGQSVPFKLTEIASIQKGTATSSLTLVSVQTTASYYCKVFQDNGSFQFNGPFTVTINYGCIAPGARQSAGEVTAGVAEIPLTVTLLPNPVVNGQLGALVRGAGGQSLVVELVDLRGQVLHRQAWPVAEAEQGVGLTVSVQSAGVYLLRAQTATGVALVKVVQP